MKINKITLENIRSYSNQSISFPQGTVLLNGNIGCGKSTILMALEFALFGLTKGEMTGNALLRNGEKHGSVELDMDVNGKSVIIKRTLKRGTAISQEDGHIIFDGRKIEGTALELKEKVLDLLNYPKELLSKGTSMIYRYTVYTPQEDMKLILMGDEKYRIDALRRVFGIDKYKKIGENCARFVGKLKEKKKEYAGSIADLEEKTKMKKERLSEMSIHEKDLAIASEGLAKAVSMVKITEAKLSRLEDESKMLQDLKKQLEVLHVEQRYKLENISRSKELLKELQTEVAELKKTSGMNPVSNEQDQLRSLQSEHANIQSYLDELRRKMSKEEIIILTAEELLKGMRGLDVCPTCKQKVEKGHVDRMHADENAKVTKSRAELEKFQQMKQQKDSALKDLTAKIEALKDFLRQHELAASRQESLALKEKKVELLVKQIDTFKIDLGNISTKLEELQKKSSLSTGLEQEHSALKSELLKAKELEKSYAIEKKGIETRMFELRRSLDELDREIQRKMATKNNLVRLMSLQQWLEEYFISLMYLMEKKIMSKVHHDFESLFQRLFTMMVDAEDMKVRLNDEFTPIIEQNGHEIEYKFLSGGEKTAGALAYRLALNQVINDLISTINTKDLLILDEPTDGFSDEQLDRLRNVLEELDIGQIILVSHEDKVESFVDSVIRLEKKEHVTTVLN